MKRNVPPLMGDRVTLRLLEEADLPLTRSWRNRYEIRRWFFRSDVVSAEAHASWFRSYTERDDDFVFVIEETSELRRPVGQVSLYNVDWERRRGEYGRLMVGDSEARGRGLARSATETLLDWALGPLGLDEVHLDVYEDNAPAVAVYEACGFVQARRENRVLRMTKRRSRSPKWAP
jgi:diamine N-acetyltransferase